MKQVNSNIRFLFNLELPILLNYNDIVKTIGITPSLLHYLLVPDTKIYEELKIKKRNGKIRVVYKPCYSLKMVQKWILTNILYKIKVSNNCYGFVKSKGSLLKKNAEAHLGCKYLLKLDLKNFFNTLSFYDVYKVFASVGYPKEVSVILARLCTYNDILPQGAVTSPYLSNLITFRLDRRLNGLAADKEIVYTRYADDLMFSSDNAEILKSIYTVILKIIVNEKLIVNHDKTHFITPSNKLQVLGITINDGNIKASKKLKKQIRSSIFNMITTGNYDDINIVRGQISYVNSIEDTYVAKIRKYILSLYNKDIWNKDLVKIFNENRILKDLPKQTLNIIDENNISDSNHILIPD